MRVMGIDYGTVRIGLAVSDPDGIIAQPKGFMKADPQKQCIAEIGRMCQDLKIGSIVIGLPLHMNGEEGESAEAARSLGKAIQDQIGITVSFIDERWTTISAEKALIEGNVKGKKKKDKVDSVAAAIILQNFLDRERPS